MIVERVGALRLVVYRYVDPDSDQRRRVLQTDVLVTFRGEQTGGTWLLHNRAYAGMGPRLELAVLATLRLMAGRVGIPPAESSGEWSGHVCGALARGQAVTLAGVDLVVGR